MTVKELIRRLKEVDPNLTVVSAYGSGEYVVPQFRYKSIYRHRDPSYMVPSYTDTQSKTTDQKPTEVLILGLA